MAHRGAGSDRLLALDPARIDTVESTCSPGQNQLGQAESLRHPQRTPTNHCRLPRILSPLPKRRTSLTKYYQACTANPIHPTVTVEMCRSSPFREPPVRRRDDRRRTRPNWPDSLQYEHRQTSAGPARHCTELASALAQKDKLSLRVPLELWGIAQCQLEDGTKGDPERFWFRSSRRFVRRCCSADRRVVTFFGS